MPMANPPAAKERTRRGCLPPLRGAGPTKTARYAAGKRNRPTGRLEPLRVHDSKAREEGLQTGAVNPSEEERHE